MHLTFPKFSADSFNIYSCMLRPKTTLSWDYFLTGIIFKNRNMRGLPVAISFNYFIFMIAITW